MLWEVKFFDVQLICKFHVLKKENSLCLLTTYREKEFFTGHETKLLGYLPRVIYCQSFVFKIARTVHEREIGDTAVCFAKRGQLYQEFRSIQTRQRHPSSSSTSIHTRV